MRVLVACEFSGIVRDAFTELGHYALSVDLLPSERSGPHWRGDIRDVLDSEYLPFDLLIAHPPCTELLHADIPHVAVENPIMHGHARDIVGRGPDQLIQPWQFGHGETKATGLWLRNLPPLAPTNIVPEREPRVHYASPGPDRWKERSRTLPGIAAAMAAQWGALDVRAVA